MKPIGLPGTFGLQAGEDVRIVQRDWVILGNILPKHWPGPQMPARRIIEEEAARCQCHAAEITGASRKPDVADARWAAINRMIVELGMSERQIAKILGRSESAIMQGLDRRFA